MVENGQAFYFYKVPWDQLDGENHWLMYLWKYLPGWFFTYWWKTLVSLWLGTKPVGDGGHMEPHFPHWTIFVSIQMLAILHRNAQICHLVYCKEVSDVMMKICLWIDFWTLSVPRPKQNKHLICSSDIDEQSLPMSFIGLKIRLLTVNNHLEL